MFWRTSRIGKTPLVMLAVLGLLAIAFVEGSLHRVKQRWFEEKLRAAKLTERAQMAIRNAPGAKRIVVDPVADPNGTGLIGEQFTIITTDQGDLDAKLTTTNPNWAAVVVDMLKRAGVSEGDFVAISWTGSMPALNIAVLAAVETIGAKPVIISSIGASMWGANNPDFAWLDMERLLYEKGIFHHRSVAASIGGRGDRGGNLSPRGREICRNIARRNGVKLLEGETLDEAIKLRYDEFKRHLPEGENYDAYINVGGGLASIGSFHNLELLPPGLVKNMPKYNYPIRGTMILFGEEGVPIVNLRDIKKIAVKYGLPIAPQPIPDPPSGGVFFRNRYRTGTVAIVLFAYAVVTFIVVRVDVLKALRRKG